MIVPKYELRQIVKGALGEVVTVDPPPVGADVWVRESPRVDPACRATVVDVWPLTEGGHAVLLERVKNGFTIVERDRPARPALRLTRQQRKALFEGGFPHIGGTGQCPVKAGESIRLSSRVELQVVRVDVQRGRWKVMYELKDRRDTIRLLRRTPPAHADGDEAAAPTPAALKDAAEQSAYTSVESAAVADAGEAPPKQWLDVRARTVSEFDHQRRLAKHAEELRGKSKAKRSRRWAA